MTRDDIQGFYADEGSLEKEDYVIFHYIFETTIDPFEAAAHLCQETSTAQWKEPGKDEDFRPKYGAKVLDLDVLEEKDNSQFLRSEPDGKKYFNIRTRIAHPIGNFGFSIPNLLTVAMGEGAFFCGVITSIKLVDIEFPASYLAHFNGPNFGVAGIRRVLNITDRPIFFGVVKPNVGLPPTEFAKIAKEAWLGGLDAAKDDEMLADTNYSPFEERMKLVSQAMKEAMDATGEAKMFVANITDEVDRLLYLHDAAVKNGVNAVMVNVMAIGLSGVRMLTKHSIVPVIAHFDCIAPMSRHPNFGVATTVITKLQRLVGCDAIIMPGFGQRMMTPDDEVIANVNECINPLGKLRSSLAIPGGSDWAGSLPNLYEKLRTIDFACVPGRGVFGHPMGPRAGAMSLRQAWRSIISKAPLAQYAETHPELAEAIDYFGKSQDTSFGKSKSQDITTFKGYTGASIYFKN